MTFQEGSSVLKLIKFQDDQYQVISGQKGVLPKGDLKSAAKAMKDLGVSLKEFELAVVDMERLGHNVADFGVYKKSFLFSSLEKFGGELFGNS